MQDRCKKIEDRFSIVYMLLCGVLNIVEVWAVVILLDFKTMLQVEIHINCYNWAETQDHLDGG